METVSVLEHPMADVTVTIYVVEEIGAATGFAIVVLLNPADGLQEYDPPPLLESVTVFPVQMVVLGPALMTGAAPMVTFSVMGPAEHLFAL